MDQRAKDVREFHKKYGYPVRTSPCIPTDDEIRFRLKLISEEYVELLGACIPCDELQALKVRIDDLVANTPVFVDLVELADAMEDLDYVVDGTRAYCGLDGEPIHAEVHRSNMAKGPIDESGKPTKPSDWTPPDVELEIAKQVLGPRKAMCVATALRKK